MSVYSKFRDDKSKKHRSKYYKSRVFDPNCRCHGGCNWCTGNRLFTLKRNNFKLKTELECKKEYELESID